MFYSKKIIKEGLVIKVHSIKLEDVDENIGEVTDELNEYLNWEIGSWKNSKPFIERYLKDPEDLVTSSSYDGGEILFNKDKIISYITETYKNELDKYNNSNRKKVLDFSGVYKLFNCGLLWYKEDVVELIASTCNLDVKRFRGNSYRVEGEVKLKRSVSSLKESIKDCILELKNELVRYDIDIKCYSNIQNTEVLCNYCSNLFNIIEKIDGEGRVYELLVKVRNRSYYWDSKGRKRVSMEELWKDVGEKEEHYYKLKENYIKKYFL